MKKLLSLPLALVLFFAIYTPVYAASGDFADVPADAWYHDPVYTAARLGLISGYDKTRFGPNDPVTYAQYATMLARILWSDEVESYASICQGRPWYMSYVLICEDHGVFAGTRFEDCPNWDDANQPISREAMAQMSYNLLSVAGVDMSMTQAEELLGTARIKDYDKIDAANKQAVVWCYVEGVLNGYTNGNFGAKDKLSRAEAATVLCQVYGRATGDVTGTGKPVTSNPPQTEVKKPADAIGGQYDTSKYSVPADANKDGYITEAEVQAVLDALQKEFPSGTKWNDPTVWGTDRTNHNGYITSYGGYSQIHYYKSPVLPSAYGCAAWAALVSDRIFGDLPKREITDAYGMQIGDLIWDKGSPHWMVYMGQHPTSSTRYSESSSGSVPESTIGYGTKYAATYDQTQAFIDANTFDVYTRYPAG